MTMTGKVRIRWLVNKRIAEKRAARENEAERKAYIERDTVATSLMTADDRALFFDELPDDMPEADRRTIKRLRQHGDILEFAQALLELRAKGQA